MALTGYRRAWGKRSGGIRAVAMVTAAGIEAAEFDESGVCTALTLAEGAAFARYRFDEDQASYVETVTYGSGGLWVTHALWFALGRMDGASRRVVEELAESTPEGIVALVTTNNGVALLVGYSERFGAERALRLVKSVGTTGRKLSDAGIEEILLGSTDAAKAPVYAGAER